MTIQILDNTKPGLAMATNRLTGLPKELSLEIARLLLTSEEYLDDLCNFRLTCHSLDMIGIDVMREYRQNQIQSLHREPSIRKHVYFKVFDSPGQTNMLSAVSRNHLLVQDISTLRIQFLQQYERKAIAPVNLQECVSSCKRLVSLRKVIIEMPRAEHQLENIILFLPVVLDRAWVHTCAIIKGIYESGSPIPLHIHLPEIMFPKTKSAADHVARAFKGVQHLKICLHEPFWPHSLPAHHVNGWMSILHKASPTLKSIEMIRLNYDNRSWARYESCTLYNHLVDCRYGHITKINLSDVDVPSLSIKKMIEGIRDTLCFLVLRCVILDDGDIYALVLWMKATLGQLALPPTPLRTCSLSFVANGQNFHSLATIVKAGGFRWEVPRDYIATAINNGFSSPLMPGHWEIGNFIIGGQFKDIIDGDGDWCLYVETAEHNNTLSDPSGQSYGSIMVSPRPDDDNYYNEVSIRKFAKGLFEMQDEFELSEDEK